MAMILLSTGLADWQLKVVYQHKITTMSTYIKKYNLLICNEINKFFLIIYKNRVIFWFKSFVIKSTSSLLSIIARLLVLASENILDIFSIH
jgi:hypothetical protein